MALCISVLWVLVLMSESVKYVTVSIPKAVADNIDFLIDELGFWPSRSSFVREASLEKFKREMQRVAELRESGIEPVFSRNRRAPVSLVARERSERG